MAKKAQKSDDKLGGTKKITFRFIAESGAKVYLSGSFSGWDMEAKKMRYSAAKGLFQTTVELSPGLYEYKFVVNGKWCADPQNPRFTANEFGSINSVIEVV